MLSAMPSQFTETIRKVSRGGATSRETDFMTPSLMDVLTEQAEGTTLKSPVTQVPRARGRRGIAWGFAKALTLPRQPTTTASTKLRRGLAKSMSNAATSATSDVRPGCTALPRLC